MTTAADDSNSGRSAAADPLAVATPDIVNLTLIRRKGTFAVLKLDPFCEEHVSAAASLLVGAADDEIAFIARTPTEVSAVVGSDKVRRIHAATCAQAAVVVDDGWACFMVEGTMAFSIVGIMARLSGCLAAAGVSLLAQSTFDTDYIFVKAEKAQAAEEAMAGIGVTIKQR